MQATAFPLPFPLRPQARAQHWPTLFSALSQHSVASAMPKSENLLVSASLWAGTPSRLAAGLRGPPIAPSPPLEWDPAASHNPTPTWWQLGVHCAVRSPTSHSRPATLAPSGPHFLLHTPPSDTLLPTKTHLLILSNGATPWPSTSRSTCLLQLSAGIQAMYHHYLA